MNLKDIRFKLSNYSFIILIALKFSLICLVRPLDGCFTWIKYYLLNQPLFVRLRGYTSNQGVCSTGGLLEGIPPPSMCPLYSFDLPVLYRNCRASERDQKLITLNVNKTKKDFRRNRNCLQTMAGMELVQEAEEYNYLSVHLHITLDQRCNYEAVYQQGQSRIWERLIYLLLSSVVVAAYE